ncbi:hypothetical protein GCM10027280_17220 [Micromonospora polyrhachis]|uniref:NhaP-type Na+/H+ or K+/H+ antiporter n=1 Tax=Micromonospora polyrhachis TaxID=1282883 RepID=A0A7W7SP61_9ACTN|nr:hypothetical protein [Micromonospora polyrhachis]MBB4958390.1 NhaP-type Na+/H+ or K+/H+ antiporter [Micromonospora polyrhachis]
MAIVVAILCAIVTVLIAVTAVYTAIHFADDHELYGSAWLVVLFLAALGVISGLATSYLGWRGIRQLRAHR